MEFRGRPALRKLDCPTTPPATQGFFAMLSTTPHGRRRRPRPEPPAVSAPQLAGARTTDDGTGRTSGTRTQFQASRPRQELSGAPAAATSASSGSGRYVTRSLPQTQQQRRAAGATTAEPPPAAATVTTNSRPRLTPRRPPPGRLASRP